MRYRAAANITPHQKRGRFALQQEADDLLREPVTL
jgi:hypothetical protein